MRMGRKSEKRAQLVVAAHPDDIDEVLRLTIAAIPSVSSDITRLPLLTNDDVELLFERISKDSRVLHAISPSFLSERRPLFAMLKKLDDDEFLHAYAAAVTPLRLVAQFGPGIDPQWDRIDITEFWTREFEELENSIAPQRSDHMTETERAIAADELERVEFVSGKVGFFFDLIEAHSQFCTPDELASSNEIREHLTGTHQVTIPAIRHEDDDNEIARLRAIAKLISVPSNPRDPEYPWLAPNKPATPSFDRDFFGRTVTIKDESSNWTGSHKDRMAWEIVVHYRNLIRQRIAEQLPPTLPSASIISNGSAAVAVQSALRWFGLPDLHVLVDEAASPEIAERLETIGCSVFATDLESQELDSQSILELTENLDGFDITRRDYVDANRVKYYDWLSYEILNLSPRHVFVPVGTGDLLHNIARILRTELARGTPDPRLDVPLATLWGINLIGATTEDPNSSMDKLYAKFRPPLDRVKDYLREQREAGYFGPLSQVRNVADDRVELALSWAATNNIRTEPSGIAGLGLLLEMNQEISQEKVVIVNTGAMHLPTLAEL
jgi:Pyridoxal-phosphate dependent enzyme